jgi:hypothetical protein
MKIEEACARLGLMRMRTIKDALPPEFTFEEIRLVAAHLRRRELRPSLHPRTGNLRE